jgi:penicillin-binding protein 1C
MKKYWWLISLLLSLLLLSSASWFFIHKPKLLTGIDFSTVIYDSQHRLLRVTLTNDQKYRVFTPLANIPKNMLAATLLKEDKDFYRHLSIDFPSLAAAFWQTYIKREHRRGASTIVMQVARLRYHVNSHTLIGKLQQIFLALQLAHFYSKADILTAYFNLAPYGNNIEGVAAASLIYYHQPVARLSLPQILTLSVIPQNPDKRSLTPKNYQNLFLSRQKLFAQWLALYPEDSQYQSIINLPLTNYDRQQLPFLAPHFVEQVLHNLSLEQQHVATTLDLSLQQSIERTITQYLQSVHRQGVFNAAALLVDTRTMAIKALIGSADFFNTDIQGQVNGTLALRSPGSALKPFIYGLALDQGLIHPATILKDAPISFGTYDPENFDNRFLGPISAQNALIQSRNIPAIYVASQLKNPTLYQFLYQAGIALKAEEVYGLALVLGGAELSMQQLVSLYAMLANQGILHSLNFVLPSIPDRGKRLLSREASFLVLKMLHNNPPPNMLNLPNLSPSYPIAWKTGTSSGFRDGWTVGVFDHYVLAVWIGNFSGQGNPAFTGFAGAAPLFFNIVNAIQDRLEPLGDTTAAWRDLNVKQVSICTPSGKLPTPLCPYLSKTWFIPGKSPIQKDDVYREVMQNLQTGLRTCHFQPKNKFVVYEFWPSDILKIFQQASIPKRQPPRYESNCELFADVSNSVAPQITSLKMGMEYVIQNNIQNTLKLPLLAVTDGDVDSLYWFANDIYLGKSTPNQILWWHAKVGEYKLRVVDSHGQVDVSEIKVVSVPK